MREIIGVASLLAGLAIWIVVDERLTQLRATRALRDFYKQRAGRRD